MQILFTGNKPQKKTYSYSVKENNNSNVITFILDKVQEGLDLSSLSCFVKVQGLEIDKDVPNVEVVEDKIHVNWTLLRKHTDSRMLSIQLQFEGHGDVIWQSEIMQLVLSDTIKADEYIENKYPSELADHEDRIKYLEEHGTSIEFDEVPTEGSQNPVTSNGIFLSLQDVIAIAEGKTQSFTLSAETNPTFDSEEDYIEVSSFVDINGNTIDTTKLHVGDICLITQLQVPDRWVADITNGVAKLYRLETTKVDLSAYYTKTESDGRYLAKANSTAINEINAVDIVPNNLTDGQISIFTNGKPTLIRGDFLGLHNPILQPAQLVGTGYYGTISGWSATSGTYSATEASYLIVITPTSKRIQIDLTNGRIEALLKSINGKQLPISPTDLTKQYKLIQQKTSGALGYVEDSEEIVIQLDTGTYTSGTPMSDNDYNQLLPLTNLTYEQLSKLKITFMIKYSNRNETYTTKTYVIRNNQVGFTGGWYSIEMYVSWFITNFSILKNNIINKTW